MHVRKKLLQESEMYSNISLFSVSHEVPTIFRTLISDLDFSGEEEQDIGELEVLIYSPRTLRVRRLESVKPEIICFWFHLRKGRGKREANSLVWGRMEYPALR